MTEVLFKAGPGVSKEWVRRVVEGTLRAEKTKGQISVLITDNLSIRKINKRFLKHDYATDVISFDLAGVGGGVTPGARLKPGTWSNASDAPTRVGDIVVSAERARRSAKELKIPYKQELARYLVHGTLHLLGYDDRKKKDHACMHDRQERIIASFEEIG